ncbi:MAG: DNA repair protein RadC [Solibacillus isronensis]
MGKRIEVYKAQAVQLVRESAKVYNLTTNVIKSPEDGYHIIKELFQVDKLPNENFMMLTLNTKNKVMGAHIVFVGTLNASVIHPREIFQRALLNNAASIIVAHNHPSGSLAPSPEDIDVTERLRDAGKLMGIEVLDHLIMGDGYISLKEKGYIS